MDKNENIVQTRGRHTSEWDKKGYETSVIGRQEREKTLWTIHNGVFDAPTVYILTWPHFTVSVLTIYCIQRQYLSF